MTQHQFHFPVIILGIATFYFFLSIRKCFFLFSLHIIDLCYIIWYNRSISFFIFHYLKTFQGIFIVSVTKSQETVVIICINIVRVILYLSYRIKKRLCLVKLLQSKIGIALVKFHISNFTVAQISNPGIFIVFRSIRKFLLTE